MQLAFGRTTDRDEIPSAWAAEGTDRGLGTSQSAEIDSLSL